MQRLVVIIFLVALISAQAAQRRGPPPPKRIDYSKFKHSTHQGKVDGVLRKGQPQELNCAYCHQTPTAEKPEVTGFPNTKPGSQLTHSSCTDCHAMTGRGMTSSEQTHPKMCLICHASARLSISELRTNVRPFPNVSSGAQSEFFDNYSHFDHSGYFELSATFKERFKDKTKFKEKDNFECAACHTINRQPVKIANAEFAAGVRASTPGHSQCFVCHFNEKEVAAKRASFATNCVGCHAIEKKPKGVGTEHSVLWFDREIIAPEKNPAKTGVKPIKPFSHKTHEEAIGTDTKSCLECHATGKRSEKRSDFFAIDRRTQEKQPRAGNCVECHRKEMQQKIEGAMTIEAAKCNYCHALSVIKQRGVSGVAFPPASHFYKKPVPTPTPTPTPKTE